MSQIKQNIFVAICVDCVYNWFIYHLQITYCPNIVGSKSIDYFHVKAIGNISKTVVKCIGSSKGKIQCNTYEIHCNQLSTYHTKSTDKDN